MVTLKRSLSLTQLTFYGVGTIIGAGIYSVIGAAAGDAGSLLWVSFIIAGIAAFMTVLSYMELSSMFSQAGGEFSYLKHAFRSPLLPFMAGFLVIFNAAATAAAVSLAFAGYLGVFFDLPQMAAALCLILACTVVNIIGIKQSAWAGIMLVCVEVAGLILLIAVGFSEGSIEKNWRIDNAGSAGVSGLLSAAALIFFVYIGFEDIVNLSEEAHEPTRNIPKALLLSITFTTVIYVLVALAVVGLADPVSLAISKSPLTEVGWMVAPWIGNGLAIAALFSTESTVLITLVSISRLLFGMGRSGVMPKITGNVLKKTGTPWVAALALCAGASLFLLLEDIKTVASVTAFGALVVFIAVHAALIALRYKLPQAKRPYRIPFSIGKLPLLPVIGILVSLVFLGQFDLQVYLIEAGVFAFGLTLYILRRRPNTDI